MLVLAVSKYLFHSIGVDDLLGLNPLGPKAVQVRVPPSAPTLSMIFGPLTLSLSTRYLLDRSDSGPRRAGVQNLDP